MKSNDELLDELFTLDDKVDNFFGTYKYSNKDMKRPELRDQLQELMLRRQALETQLSESMTILFRPGYYNIYQNDRANWGADVTVYYLKDGQPVAERHLGSDAASALVFGFMNSAYKGGWVIEQPLWMLRNTKIEAILKNN